MSTESELSLPTEVAHGDRSSPPIATQYSLPPMDDLTPQSEPVAPHEMEQTLDMQQTQDVQQTPKRKHKRVNSDETERPASAQRDRPKEPEEQSDLKEGLELSDEDADADPAEPIIDFDWQDLHEKYHKAIDQCSQEEKKLMQEWESLMEYFHIWAASGHEHETDRTFHRLQTRTQYVRNEENALETTRIHYTNVVSSFESALNLLKANSMPFRG